MSLLLLFAGATGEAVVIVVGPYAKFRALRAEGDNFRANRRETTRYRARGR